MNFKHRFPILTLLPFLAHADLPLTAPNILADKQYLGETVLKSRRNI